WGLSRIADLVLSNKRVDDKRVSVIGFSRLGKASLWAGATDERFAATISECSGAGGAKLFHRNEGEKVRNLVGVGYWFCRNFAQYAGRDTALPFDAHEMMSLIAPRALYVASATADGYADPQGEYAALQLTAPVYKLLGHRSNLPADFPAADTPVGAGARLGYHVRTGKHDVTPQDWEYILSFLDKLKIE
ncbi:MAG: acetylxylan esterase, partial [Prevotellaceae bacterium]|nr:acetylxylan esterase [Prevotellaceae bacterium]